MKTYKVTGLPGTYSEDATFYVYKDTLVPSTHSNTTVIVPCSNLFDVLHNVRMYTSASDYANAFKDDKDTYEDYVEIYHNYCQDYGLITNEKHNPLYATVIDGRLTMVCFAKDAQVHEIYTITRLVRVGLAVEFESVDI